MLFVKFVRFVQFINFLGFPPEIFEFVSYSFDESGKILEEMAPASNEEQFKFLISCIRHSNNGKVGSGLSIPIHCCDSDCG